MGVENSILVTLRIWRTGQHMHLHQEFPGVFITVSNSRVVLFSDLFGLILPYLEPISTVSTKVVRGPHFIPNSLMACTRIYFVP